jgi:hypothetical protein
MAATRTASVFRAAPSAARSERSERSERDDAQHEERFCSEGRAWLWREGPAMVPPSYRAASDADRDALEDLFSRRLLPQADKRGIAGELFTARAPDGVSRADVRWVRWQHPEHESAPLWALFVQSRALGETVASNDAWTVVAWGDGPALAWASEDARAQDFLRSALRAPPPWLRAGMASRDRAFPVRIERESAQGPRRAGTVVSARRTDEGAIEAEFRPRPRAAAASASEPSPAFDPPRGQGARAVLAAWRRAHPAR